MNNIGIISGGGTLPVAIGKNLSKKDLNVVFFVIEDSFDPLIYEEQEVCIINLNSAKQIIKHLKSYKIDDIILAGNIKRPSIKDIKFDFQTLKIAKNLLVKKNGDNQLLESIKEFFYENGFGYFDWKNFCPELFSKDDYLTTSKPSKQAQENLEVALKIFNNYGRLDLGQSIIVQNQIILGLEAVEGTDELIIRCNNLKKSGDKGILVKLSKYNQSNILDIPTIGKNTIKVLSLNDYEGIFLEKNHCIILDKDETINIANNNNIFISTCNKIE